MAKDFKFSIVANFRDLRPRGRRDRIETFRVQADGYEEVGKCGAARVCRRQAERLTKQLQKLDASGAGGLPPWPAWPGRRGG